jgi:hypothetical protein
MSLEIRELPHFTDWIRANFELGREHYDEIALNKRLMVYAPDFDSFDRMEAQGALACVGIFDGDVIVGYSVNIVVNHLHYRDLLVAHNDMIFIAQSHRKGRAGLTLIKATKELCAGRGARMMLWHAKEGSALAKLLPRLGCGVQDILFSEGL